MELTVHLFRQGILDAETAMQVLSARIERRVPLGRVAVKLGLLSVKEVIRTLEFQADQPRPIRFGESAVRLGLLTAEDLDHILREQVRAQPSEDELLTSIAGLPSTEIAQMRRRLRDRMRSAA